MKYMLIVYMIDNIVAIFFYKLSFYSFFYKLDQS